MTAGNVLGRVDELIDGTGGSVDAVMGAVIGPYRKSRGRANMTCRIGRFVSLLTLAATVALATLQPVSAFGETLRFVWAADSRVDSPPKDPKLVDLINKPVLDAINRGILALSPRPSFMVFGGDMAYRGKYKGQWTFDTWIGVMKPLTDAGIPIYTTLGNHELYQHPDTAWSFNLENQQQFQQTFTTNPSNGPPGYERLAYSFTSPGGDAFFAVLDPYFLTDNANPANLTGTIDDIQLAWLESQVAQTKATHKFLFIHTPYYYVSAPPPVPDVSFTRLWQIVDTHHFDVYFCGHSHLFSRKTIDSSIRPNPPLRHPIVWHNNVVQVLNGAAGAGPDTGPLSVDKTLWHVANDAQTYYFTVVDIDGGRVTVTSYKGDTADYAAFDIFTIPESSLLLSAVLPESRSVQVNGTATAFATIINTGTSTGTSCSIAPAVSLPINFVYQTTNPTTNALTGSPNTPVDIAAGGSQSFVIGLTPTAAIAPTNVAFNFSCTNTSPAPINIGLNTLLLSGSTSPTPDVVALAATASNDGILHIPGASGASSFAVASINLGATAAITVTANTNGASLPLTITLCQINPATSHCLATPAASVNTTIDANAAPTFGIFATASGTVPFDPANSRIFVQFTDSSDAVRGETSVAVETP
jgi:hypothetical protein